MDQETSLFKNYEAQKIIFQEANLLNIINHYVNLFYNKIAYCTSILSGKAYI